MSEMIEKFTASMDALTRDVEIRSDKGRRVAIVKAMASEQMTWTYADVMCAALISYVAQKRSE